MSNIFLSGEPQKFLQFLAGIFSKSLKPSLCWYRTFYYFIIYLFYYKNRTES